MKKTTQKKTLVLGIIFLFLVSGVASSQELFKLEDFRH